MKPLVLKLIICSLIVSCCIDADAQVRVRRWWHIAAQKKEKKALRTNNTKNTLPKSVKATVTAYPQSQTRIETDAQFHVPWSGTRRLHYDDFLCNKNLYNKFLPARDTDLTKVIYPDYRDFYKKLSERVNTADGMEDVFWQERIERLLKAKTDSIDAGYLDGTYNDIDLSFTISIDSPAASVINISPVIYSVNETTYYYNITALFSRFSSWMIVKSADILEHEQIHFDIFELYARRMRKHLVATLKQNYIDGTPGDIASDITPAYEQLYQQLNDMQLEFDRQTMALTANNAPLLTTNASWTKELRRQLEAFREYALPEGNVILTAPNP
ncbi:MAG: hypothetical protein K9G49_11340 [Taibaiella sp.]|nr:hypothetical protein [Taibaiella sp.]